MIDIHSHLIPNVDDGSNSLELSRELLIMAINEGIQGAIITPHFIKTDADSNIRREQLKERFKQFKKDNADLSIQLFLGNELYIDRELDSLLLRKEINSLNDSQYVLVEFPFDNYRDDYDEYLYNISLNYRIIIAHPERYHYVHKNKDFVKRWLECGYYLQANAQSLYVRENKEIIDYCIKKGWLSFIASDAHSKHRPLSLKAAYDYVEKKYNKDVAELLMHENPKMVINNKLVLSVPPTKKRLF